MKKAKPRNVYEEKSDPVRSLNMQLDGDDDEIIELEDIIEMPDRPIDEDEDLDLGVEIFDVDEELESRPSRSAQKTARGSESSRQDEEDDLLDSLTADADEDELLFDPTASAPQGKGLSEKDQLALFGEEEDEESLLDGLLEESASDSRMDERVDLRSRAEAAMRIAEEDRPPEPAPAIADETGAAPGAAGPSMSEISAVAEELIGRIESSLQEHIRAVVESMLPGLVRSIIDEELAKLKKELE